jgi:Fe(3+) dicitrate transport protein
MFDWDSRADDAGAVWQAFLARGRPNDGLLEAGLLPYYLQTCRRFDDLGGTGISAPVSLVYTYTDARFQTSFASAYGPWGSVSEGDFLPYMPKHQITLNAGLEGRGWRLSATANHVSAARAVAGQGTIPATQRIDSRTLVDLAAEVDLWRGLSVFATVQNLFDEVYNVAFSPAGARPRAPRLVLGGLRARF